MSRHGLSFLYNSRRNHGEEGLPRKPFNCKVLATPCFSAGTSLIRLEYCPLLVRILHCHRQFPPLFGKKPSKSRYILCTPTHCTFSSQVDYFRICPLSRSLCDSIHRRRHSSRLKNRAPLYKRTDRLATVCRESRIDVRELLCGCGLILLNRGRGFSDHI
jgi:hypothetical protein